MRVPRYPLESENRRVILSEHTGNQVNDGLCVDSLEATTCYAPLSSAAAAQFSDTRLLNARLARAPVFSRRKPTVKEQLPPALRAVKNARDPASRPGYRTAALVRAFPCRVRVKNLVRAPP